MLLAKTHSQNHYENGNKKFFHNMPQVQPNPGFMQEKVQKGDSKLEAGIFLAV